MIASGLTLSENMTRLTRSVRHQHIAPGVIEKMRHEDEDE